MSRARARKKERRRLKHETECCVLFTVALHSGGSFDEGLLFCYSFRIPGKGRGAARTLTRNLVLKHCPFCGAPPKAGPKPDSDRIAERLKESEG